MCDGCTFRNGQCIETKTSVVNFEPGGGTYHYKNGSQTCKNVSYRVRNLKFATYLKFATCENTNKINELW